jgi:hypothetical protein
MKGPIKKAKPKQDDREIIAEEMVNFMDRCIARGSDDPGYVEFLTFSIIGGFIFKRSPEEFEEYVNGVLGKYSDLKMVYK